MRSLAVAVVLVLAAVVLVVLVLVLVAVLAPGSVQPAWAVLRWAAERRRERLAEPPLRDLWEVDCQAPAVRRAMEPLEPAIRP
ncbi:hypothetical protein [Bradyrhizobium sp.]|uniref:hypothetical protein n=1 Tax=Bradyrhizobium sp. TaxID=376 RepID=UPI0025B8901F|nr:hypothetical protein [Bradyrhizobium sp.]MBV8920978.1 hypothetical protein [Bradyrhizobium sp.]